MSPINSPHQHWARWSGDSPGGAAAFADTKCLLFDGVDEMLSGGTSVMAGMSASFTVGCWFRITSNQTTKVLVSKDDRTTGKKMFQLQIEATNKIAAYVWDQDAGGFVYKGRITNSTFTNNAWHHALMVWNGSVVALYIDGVADTADYSGGAFTGITNTAAEFLVGAYYEGGYGRQWNGYLNHIAVWSNALSSGEAVPLAVSPFDVRNDSGAYVSSGTLVNFWSIGESPDDATASNGIKDLKGSLHLTAVNMEAGDIVSTP